MLFICAFSYNLYFYSYVFFVVFHYILIAFKIDWPILAIPAKTKYRELAIPMDPELQIDQRGAIFSINKAKCVFLIYFFFTTTPF